MKKSLWMAGLILSTFFVATAAQAADSPQLPQDLQDQAFVQQLAQQNEAPAPPAEGDCPTATAIAAVYCPGVYCTQDGDCWDHCIGGVGSSYCNRFQHQCYPY
jgi:hypothetical protein